MPFVTKMEKFSVRTIREDSDIETYIKDLQIARLKISVSYNIKEADVKRIYAEYGEGYREKLIWNYLTQSIKDIIGKYNAESLIEQRQQATNEILFDVRLITKNLPVEFNSLQLIDIGYSKEFELAIEKKVIAAQRAKEAENKTNEIKQEAEQKVISAKAEAESMKIRANALMSNPKLVAYEIAQKWDGQLPKFIGGNSIPMLNLEDTK
jgi:regulator of protease activity HflC (stomatin/prohibitin superfamily)